MSSSTQHRVLLVEDSLVDARLVTGMLRDSGLVLEHVRSLAAASEALVMGEHVDLVLLDLGLPDSHGLETFRRLHTTVPAVPMVVFTGRDDLETVEQAVKLGAQDYLVKGEVSRSLLLRSIKYAIERHRALDRAEQLNGLLQAIRRIDQIIVRERDVERMIHEACETLVDSRRYLGASIIAAGQGVPPAAATAGSVGKDAAELLARAKRGEWPPCHRAALATPGKLAMLEPRDCSACALDAGAVKYAAAVLLRHGDADLGLLAVSLADGGELDAEEASLLEGVAGDLAMALHAIGIERERASLETSYRTLFNSVSDCIFVQDTKTGAPVLVNERAVELFGWSAEEFLQLSPASWSTGPPFTNEEALERIHRAAAGSRLLFEWHCKDRGGRTFWVEVSLQRAEVQGQARVLAVVRDINARKHSLEQARAASERFRAIFESHSDGILVADAETRAVRMCNPAICKMLGYAEAELLELGLGDIHPAAAVPALVQALEAQTKGQPGILVPDAPMVRKDGSVLHADMTGRATVLDGRPVTIGCFRDVTERRELQASLAQSERLASVGLLAAGVAHEINNPLTYVLYNLECLATSLPEIKDPRVVDLAEQAAEALEGATRVRGIVRDLHTFSRVDKDRVEPTSLNAVVDGAINMAINEIKYRARLVRQLGEVPELMANDSKLAQVVLNLLVNAAQSIDEGDVEHNQISVRTWTEGDEALVEVQDTGCGIPAANLPRVFDPFFTTKDVGAGTGLGLSICHNIVTAINGRIDVESTEGEGTRFVVHIPIASEPAPPTKEEQPPEAPKRRGRFLIVDDEIRVGQALKRLLQAEHDVEVLASGKEAIKLLGKDRAFDGLVCDLMMPDVTGMDLHRWLTEQADDLADRMIFITGGVFTPKARAFLEGVDNSRLDKPFDPHALRDLLQPLVGSATPPPL